MDNYLNLIEAKIAKLAEINDTERINDPRLKKLIATSLKLTSEYHDSTGSETVIKKPIYKLLTTENLLSLRTIFFNSVTEKTTGMDLDQFIEAFNEVLGMEVDDNQLEELFFKVDVMKGGMVTWKEYSDYLLLEMQQREKLIEIEKELLTSNIQVIKTEGRDSIKCILILPFGDFDTSDTKGVNIVGIDDCRYFTCSRDGVMNFWSSNFQTNDTFNLQKFTSRDGNMSCWVSTAEVMADQKFIVISTTNFNLLFFRYTNNNEFELCSKVDKFPGTVMCLSYYKDELPTNASFLTWGDEYGGVGVIALHLPISKTSLGTITKHDINKKTHNNSYYFTDLSNNHVYGIEARYIADIHQRNVCQVRYINKLHSWISCCKDSCDAIFVGDLVPNVSYKERIYYSVIQGVSVFEYCEKLNFIITGGADCIIRLWNPLLKGQKLMGVFRGHVSPISHLLLDQKDSFLLSVSASKDVRIFDLANQRCIQRINKNAFKALGRKPFTAACINKNNHTVVMGSNMRLAIIEGKEDSLARHSLTTLPYSITATLYNPLFKHIVTGDWKSQVIAWNAGTGDKVVHYTAHAVVQKGRRIEIEIKVMAFDSTYRRLITGHRDGMVKVWNYNVGVLLYQMPVPGAFEVSALCSCPDKIFVAGCNKSVFMHITGMANKNYVTLKPSHPDSITQLCVLPSTYLASVSLDGTLMVYSLKTNLPHLKFSISLPYSFASVDFYSSVTMESYFSDGLVPLSERIQHKYKKKTVNLRTIKKMLMGVEVNSDNLHYKYCVETMVFLHTRLITPDTAVLLTGMHDGRVLAWPMSIKGRCLGEFMAVYKENELLHAADVTSDDAFLVTGDSLGYLKVWDISHYLNPAVGACCDMLDKKRLKEWKNFSFVKMRQNIRAHVNLWDISTLPMHMKVKCDKLENYPVETPHLVNSFKAHVGDIITIKLIEMVNKYMILSTASDMSVRIWSLSGNFLGILGQKSDWSNRANEFGFLTSKQVKKEIEAASKSKEINDCGISTFHMSKDEVKGISFKESSEDLTAKAVRLERKTSRSESVSSMDQMCKDLETAEQSLLDTTFNDNFFSVYTSDKNKENSSTIGSITTFSYNKKNDYLYSSYQEVIMDLWDKVKKKTPSKFEIPADLKRVGSFTTLYVLESELGVKSLSKWAKVRHATVWIVNYLQPKHVKLFNRFILPNGDASKVGVYSNNLKDMIEEYVTNRATVNILKQKDDKLVKGDKKNMLLRPLSPLISQIFGQFYSQPYTQHRPIKPVSMAHEVARKQVSVYKKLPLATLSDKNPAKLVAQLFQQSGIHNITSGNSKIFQPVTGNGGIVANTKSKMTLVRNLNKTGWKLMSDGTLVRRKVPVNSNKNHSYLPPLLVPENSVQQGSKKKGENCLVSKNKSRITY